MMRGKIPRISAASQAIRRIVMEQPGIHFRGLSRAANVSSAGQLRHHLDRLARQGILIEVEDGRYKRFFVAGAHDAKLRPGMARFARAVPRLIAKLLLVNPMNRTELRRSLGCADSTLGYHLSRMVQLGDLAKSRGANCCRYSLTSEEQVRKMLTQGAEPDPARPPTPRPGPQPAPEPDGPTPFQPGPIPPGDLPFPGLGGLDPAPGLPSVDFPGVQTDGPRADTAVGAGAPA